MYAWVSSTLVTLPSRISCAASRTLSWVRSAGRGTEVAQPAAASASVITATMRRSIGRLLGRAIVQIGPDDSRPREYGLRPGNVEKTKVYRAGLEDRVVLPDTKEAPMARTYNVIDADGHILEPLDIWEKYIDPAYRDRAPKMIVDTDGKERLLVEGKILGSPKGLGLIGGIGARQGTVDDVTMK